MQQNKTYIEKKQKIIFLSLMEIISTLFKEED